jgi:hypothetical protein
VAGGGPSAPCGGAAAAARACFACGGLHSMHDVGPHNHGLPPVGWQEHQRRRAPSCRLLEGEPCQSADSAWLWQRPCSRNAHRPADNFTDAFKVARPIGNCLIENACARGRLEPLAGPYTMKRTPSHMPLFQVPHFWTSLQRNHPNMWLAKLVCCFQH